MQHVVLFRVTQCLFQGGHGLRAGDAHASITEVNIAFSQGGDQGLNVAGLHTEDKHDPGQEEGQGAEAQPMHSMSHHAGRPGDGQAGQTLGHWLQDAIDDGLGPAPDATLHRQVEDLGGGVVDRVAQDVVRAFEDRRRSQSRQDDQQD